MKLLLKPINLVVMRKSKLVIILGCAILKSVELLQNTRADPIHALLL